MNLILLIFLFLIIGINGKIIWYKGEVMDLLRPKDLINRRGSRSGYCPNSCLVTYEIDYYYLEKYECQFDKQCPVSYKCCFDSCLKVSMCRKAELSNPESTFPTTISIISPHDKSTTPKTSTSVSIKEKTGLSSSSTSTTSIETTSPILSTSATFTSEQENTASFITASVEHKITTESSSTTPFTTITQYQTITQNPSTSSSTKNTEHATSEISNSSSTRTTKYDTTISTSITSSFEDESTEINENDSTLPVSDTTSEDYISLPELEYVPSREEKCSDEDVGSGTLNYEDEESTANLNNEIDEEGSGQYSEGVAEDIFKEDIEERKTNRAFNEKEKDSKTVEIGIEDNYIQTDEIKTSTEAILQNDNKNNDLEIGELKKKDNKINEFQLVDENINKENNLENAKLDKERESDKNLKPERNEIEKNINDQTTEDFDPSGSGDDENEDTEHTSQHIHKENNNIIKNNTVETGYTSKESGKVEDNIIHSEENDSIIFIDDEESTNLIHNQITDNKINKKKSIPKNKQKNVDKTLLDDEDIVRNNFKEDTEKWKKNRTIDEKKKDFEGTKVEDNFIQTETQNSDSKIEKFGKELGKVNETQLVDKNINKEKNLDNTESDKTLKPRKSEVDKNINDQTTEDLEQSGYGSGDDNEQENIDKTLFDDEDIFRNDFKEEPLSFDSQGCPIIKNCESNFSKDLYGIDCGKENCPTNHICCQNPCLKHKVCYFRF